LQPALASRSYESDAVNTNEVMVNTSCWWPSLRLAYETALLLILDSSTLLYLPISGEIIAVYQ